MKTFPLNSRAKTTALKQPKELYAFARDIDRNWLFERPEVSKHLSYYYFPELILKKNVDLSLGYESFKKISDEDNLGDFGALLNSIVKHEQEHGKIAVDLVTFRGLLTKLLVLPYNTLDPIDYNIVVFDGQLFMKSDDKLELSRKKQQNERMLQGGNAEYIQRCEYGGYKFETLATLPKPWSDTSRQLIDKRFKKTVNNYEQYISVVKSGIGSVKMLIAGEVDCIWDYIPDLGSILSHYAELKTTKVVESNGQVVNFEKKLFKTWAQSFLLGVRKVVYGFRDDHLILKTVEVFDTEEIPVLIKNNPLNEKNANKINCTNALKWYGAVMEWISTEIPRDDESKSWRLSYDPGSRTFSLNEVVGEEHESWRNGAVLTKEFKQWRESLK